MQTYLYTCIWTPLTDERVRYQCGKTTNVTATSERKIHLLREISRMHLFLLMHNTIFEFNNCGTWHLNKLRHLFYLLCCNTQHIFEPGRVYEPSFNIDKCGILYAQNPVFTCGKVICITKSIWGNATSFGGKPFDFMQSFYITLWSVGHSLPRT